MGRDRLDFFEILRSLTVREVEFIVVGGVCGILHGAPISTFDLDIVHSRTPENIERLADALQDLSARYRGITAGAREPSRQDLSGPGHHLLITRDGPLDVLGMVGRGRGYSDLLNKTVGMDVGGMTIRILDLPGLIEVKEETITEKDKVVLAILHRLLEEQRGA